MGHLSGLRRSESSDLLGEGTGTEYRRAKNSGEGGRPFFKKSNRCGAPLPENKPEDDFFDDHPTPRGTWQFNEEIAESSRNNGTEEPRKDSRPVAPLPPSNGQLPLDCQAGDGGDSSILL